MLTSYLSVSSIDTNQLHLQHKVILMSLLRGALAQPISISCENNTRTGDWNGVTNGRLKFELELTDTVDLFWDARGSGPNTGPSVGIRVDFPNGDGSDDNDLLENIVDQDLREKVMLLEGLSSGIYNLTFTGTEGHEVLWIRVH